MADKIFGGETLQILKRSLDAYALRQKVIAENISQAETPGYRSRTVEFETLLDDAMGTSGGLPMKRSQEGHMPTPESSQPPPRVTQESDRALDNGVNDVNLDMEMAALAETTLSHKMAARILSMRSQLLRSAIRGRGTP